MLLVNLTKIKSEKTQISIIRYEKGDITTKSKEIQGNIRD
jgi:hypothetical protein